MNFVHVLFGFSGRATRFHFWMGQVAIIALMIVLVFSGASAYFAVKSATSVQEMLGAVGFALLVLFGLVVALTWISWAVAVKRLHDRNKSWVWMLITFVPSVLTFWSLGTGGVEGLKSFQSSYVYVIAQIAVLLWYVIDLGFMPGTQGGNMWGPAPAGTGIFSGAFDDLLSDAPNNPSGPVGSEFSMASAESGATDADRSTVTRAKSPPRPQRIGVVQRQGGFGRRNAQA